MTEPTTTKKVRRKAMTDAGRQMLQRQRQRLNREQAAMGEKLVNEARQAASIGSMLARQNDPVHNAVTRGIVRRVAAVLASEKVRPAIHVSPIVKDDGDVFAAYTDFNSIVVRYTPHADKRLLSATLRGALYHEGGHIRWTTPFTDLRQVMIDQSDDPIYAASGEATLQRLPVGLETLWKISAWRQRSSVTRLARLPTSHRWCSPRWSRPGQGRCQLAAADLAPVPAPQHPSWRSQGLRGDAR